MSATCPVVATRGEPDDDCTDVPHMIALSGKHAPWMDGRIDGIVRDDRRPHPDDGLLSGISCSLGDEAGGPSAMLTITRRLYPKKTPVHLHKSDTFRMALGEPIVVGRTSYAHGEFRLQRVNTFYGPEIWSDEVGTNQLLVMADRRGGKPYLTTPEQQILADLGRSAEEDLGEGYRQHPRDADIHHEIHNNFGATEHAGHWDAGFSDTSTWPLLPDGSRLGVIAIGGIDDGPLLLCWDRPAGSRPLASFRTEADVLRLVVSGSVQLDDRHTPVMGFSLHQGGSRHGRATPDPGGVQELWLVSDRRRWNPAPEPDATATERQTLAASVSSVATLLSEAKAAP